LKKPYIHAKPPLIFSRKKILSYNFTGPEIDRSCYYTGKDGGLFPLQDLSSLFGPAFWIAKRAIKTRGETYNFIGSSYFQSQSVVDCN
jgi:hypothetical protein